MKKEYYKVVWEENEKYFSAWVKNEQRLDFLTIEYPLNKWVYPRVKDTHLFCFNNKTDAFAFKGILYSNFRYSTNIKVFQCEIGRNIKQRVNIPNIFRWADGISKRTLQERLRIWWRGDKLPKIKLGVFRWQRPVSGTVFTDKIKLIKEVMETY